MSSVSTNDKRKQAWEDAREETKKNVAKGLLQQWAIEYGGAEDGDELVKALQSLGWRAGNFQTGWNYSIYERKLTHKGVCDGDANFFLNAVHNVCASNQQQQPPPTNGGATGVVQIGRDQSTDWIEAVRKGLELKTLPRTANELEQCLLRPLPARVYNDGHVAPSLLSPRGYRSDAFRYTVAHAMKFKLNLCTEDKSEDSVHHVTDSLLVGPMRIIAELLNHQEFRTYRNKVDDQSITAPPVSKQYRLDLRVHINSELLLVGEEKAQKLSDALTDVREKTCDWRMESVKKPFPFILGYVATGDGAEFLMIDKEVKVLHRFLRFTDADDKEVLMKMAVNAFFVMQKLSELIPTKYALPFMETVRRDREGKRHAYITRMRDYVEKIVCVVPPRENGFWKTLYTSLHTNQYACSLHHKYPNIIWNDARTRMKLRFTPIGYHNKPNTTDELQRCILHVVSAIGLAHKAGFAHCDVRWPNIIYDADRWYLIDWEQANKLTSERREGDINAVKKLVESSRVKDRVVFAKFCEQLAKCSTVDAMLVLLNSIVKTIKESLASPAKSHVRPREGDLTVQPKPKRVDIGSPKDAPK